MDWFEYHHVVPVIGAVIVTYMTARLSFMVRDRQRTARRAREDDEARQRLQEREQRLRLVFEALPTAMLMLDSGGIIVLANPQADRVFGYRDGELLGASIDSLLSDAGTGGGPPSSAGTVTPADPATERRFRGRLKDGSVVPVLVRSHALATPEGDFELVSVVDITERLMLERETEQQREELAHLARVGTLAELSGSMAHELNQPLAAILTNAQAAQRFLAHDPPNLEEVRASVADIIADDKRAGEVIRRLRAMLKKQAPDYQLVDVNLRVTEVVRLARTDLLHRRVRVTTQLQPGLPAVRADQVQLHQVFINLILNAGDAMTGEPDPHELTVTTQLLSTGQVEIRFADNGSGIPPPDVDRIFEPFVTSKRDGIGLGLAVSRSLILDHGGKLWATNNLGRGATLHVALPKVDVVAG